MLSLSEQQVKGHVGEQMAQQRLTELGHLVEFFSDFEADFDLKLPNLAVNVEVKYARPKDHHRGRGYWGKRCQWDCSRLSGKQDHVVVLIAHWDDDKYFFVVPSAIILGRGCKTPSITRHPLELANHAWLKPYLDAWHCIYTVHTWKSRLCDGQLMLL